MSCSTHPPSVSVNSGRQSFIITASIQANIEDNFRVLIIFSCEHPLTLECYTLECYTGLYLANQREII